MNFDKLANLINESMMPEGRKPNAEFQKWKAENPGVPVYKFFKMQRDKKGGSAAPTAPAQKADPVGSAVAADAPEVVSTISKDPATERTRLAVADFLSHNPEAQIDEIIDAIAIDSSEETPLNLDPAVVKAIIDEERPPVDTGMDGPTDSDLRKDVLASKYDRMRQALYKARGLKSKPGRPIKKLDGEDEDDVEEIGLGSKFDMRDEPVDPIER